MRTASLLGLTLSVVIASLAACAESDPGPMTEQSKNEANPTPDASTTIPNKPAPSSSASSNPAPVCAPKCTVDSDCSKSCPAVANAVSCCDTATSTCYTSQTQTCPAAPTEPTDPTPSY
ncbi:hypothetical protein [Labilithrix luteola]|nr:hypothetical protein [Labilithrix luteola]